MSDAFPVIDFHSHILPRLDHGCLSSSECLRQLELMSKSGTNIAIATSHFYPEQHDVDGFIKSVDKVADKLRENHPTSAPQIVYGAEVLLCPNLHTMQGIEKLCVRGTNVLLLELPFNGLKAVHYDTVESILDMGITVVLAHIDRYLDDCDCDIDELLDMGALAQINAYSLSSSKIRKKILNYLENTDKICAIGSDLHGVDEAKYKKFVKAKKVLGEYYPTVMKRSYDLLKDVL